LSHQKTDRMTDNMHLW